ncbi:hypothetical protein K438DRAFT_1994988 [Mycena galopus ATCC 62051]|nr:hypothetical protein K438DRAFT_1994988 [Mycena galopus ATCC 62051]
MLLGPETGMTSYTGAALFGTFLRSSPGLKVNLPRPPRIRPARHPPRRPYLAGRPRPRCAHPLPEHAHRDEPPHQSPDLLRPTSSPYSQPSSRAGPSAKPSDMRLSFVCSFDIEVFPVPFRFCIR